MAAVEGESESRPAVDVPPPPKEKEKEKEKKEEEEEEESPEEKEAQTLVIHSLRSEISDLISQVTLLNGKLVKSYDRISDLEDHVHTSSSRLSLLERERHQHMSLVDKGMLVEKSLVTNELTRVMERATEEAARRGEAEKAKRDIERELDELSASLFGQANGMVREARVGRAEAERKVGEVEETLRVAEEAVRSMQIQMQTLIEEKERGGRVRVRRGENKERKRLTRDNVAFSEYLAFLRHLRSLAAKQQPIPSLTLLLNLPFLARLITEDTYVSFLFPLFSLAHDGL